MGGGQEHLGKGAAPSTHTLEKKDAILSCKRVRCVLDSVRGFLYLAEGRTSALCRRSRGVGVGDTRIDVLSGQLFGPAASRRGRR
jgi:hypothetical protein